MCSYLSTWVLKTGNLTLYNYIYPSIHIVYISYIYIYLYLFFECPNFPHLKEALLELLLGTYLGESVFLILCLKNHPKANIIFSETGRRKESTVSKIYIRDAKSNFTAGILFEINKDKKYRVVRSKGREI